ncbi:hypothetical protein [Desulfonatronovibrio hydrogenovorans]|uniref:hypothetical protein n=1 Tax=Desulfonatronovibrio hydrogenovorans TaxID=53245 RepID=UPI0004916CA8|nr:hypothetical protein [Desulfonatronovibrio hydrogenovorans]
MKEKRCKRCRQIKPVDPHFIGSRGRDVKFCDDCRAKLRKHHAQYEPKGRNIPHSLQRCPWAAGEVSPVPYGGIM